MDNKYVLNNKNIDNIIFNTLNPSNKTLTPKCNNNNKNNDIDTLFWCYYILKYGYDVYKNIINISIIKEKEIKIELIPLLRKNKNIIKNIKIDVLSNLESNLLNDKNINIKTFFILCLLENINVVYIFDNILYYSLLNLVDADMDDKNIEINIINYDKKLKMYYITKTNKLEYNILIQDLIKIESLITPIKSISNYKIMELEELYFKLNKLDKEDKSDNDNKPKKYKKCELYEKILILFNKKMI